MRCCLCIFLSELLPGLEKRDHGAGHFDSTIPHKDWI